MAPAPATPSQSVAGTSAHGPSSAGNKTSEGFDSETAKGTVTVHVLYFARARELVKGMSSEEWTVDGDWTSSDLQVAILARHKQLEGLLRTCAWALNEDYIDGPRSLKSGDKLALIPPISGG